MLGFLSVFTHCFFSWLRLPWKLEEGLEGEWTTALSSVMTPRDLTLMARDMANLVKHSLKSNSVTSALFIEVVLPLVFVFFFFLA